MHTRLTVLQIPFGYFPDAVGGTETYVAALVRALAALDVSSEIAAPGAEDKHYLYDGAPVHRYRESAGEMDLRTLYGDGCTMAADGCDRVFERVKPDIVHLHALTSGVSREVVKRARNRRIPVVFTYHTPAASCVRGTLMRWGTEVCDGRLESSPCTACVLDSHGIRREVGSLLAMAPGAIGTGLGRLHLSGGVWTALRMKELVALRRRTFLAFMNEVNHVVAVCDWVKEVLLRNGVPPGKISVSRQGFGGRSVARSESTKSWRSSSKEPLRIAFLGRLHPTKGVQQLVEAILRDPSLPVCLDIFAVVQGQAGAELLQTLRGRLESSGERRIQFRNPVPPEAVGDTLTEYHLLAVPSQWLETGPLVVYEAFAAGIPVIGSDLGGIRELVTHEGDGLLVSAASAPAWTAALRRLTTEDSLYPRLRAGVRPPRGMNQVASEMAALYRQLVHSNSSPLIAAHG